MLGLGGVSGSGYTRLLVLLITSEKYVINCISYYNLLYVFIIIIIYENSLKFLFCKYNLLISKFI